MTNQDSYLSADRNDGVPDFEDLVACCYGPLYRFALSLTQTEADACDLTQETFRTWARKGHQLRDAKRVKSWLFTTLHRLFLETRRRQIRFPHVELDDAVEELPTLDPGLADRLDAAGVVALLGRVDAAFQAPLALFYLEDYSYNEIAETLGIPLGTVKSRIARGLQQLRELLLADAGTPAPARRNPA